MNLILKTFLVGIVLIFQVLSPVCQSFYPADFQFPNLSRGEIAWCDYDNDHDLDVFLTGLGNDGEGISVLYRNDEGQFVDSEFSFIPVEESMTSWGDYDSDGDKDLIVAGTSAEGDITMIYRNEGNYFSMVEAGIPATHNGDVQWVDFDEDNDLDIFISGDWITEILRNDDGFFMDIGADFGYFSGASADFADYDNDGDLDILINGDSGAGAVSKVFINDEGYFSDGQKNLAGLMAGTVHWIDYDVDGDFDAAISGFDDALEARFYLFKNSAGQFEPVNTGISGFATGGSDWADYDNDGDPDLLMSGKASGCGAYVAGIYRNDGNDVFFKIQDEIQTLTRCSLGWSDFDNDGDVDFLTSGLNPGDIPFTILYLNQDGGNVYSVNTPPSAPGELVSTADDNVVLLSWIEGQDQQTPVSGLTYNIRLGTGPGQNDVIGAQSLSGNGQRLIPGNGNAGQNLTRKIYNLEPGTYYWTVQAIDQAFEASEFPTEQSFTITATGLSDDVDSPFQFRVYPNPAKKYINIFCEEWSGYTDISVIDITGKVLINEVLHQSNSKIEIEDLQEGIYLLVIKNSEFLRSVILTKLN